MRYVLGVDAAWSVINPSGVALLACPVDGKPELCRVGRSYQEFFKDEICWEQKPTGSYPNFKALIQSCPEISVIALDIPMAPFLIEGRREVDQALSREYGKYKAAVYSPTKNCPGPLAKEIFEQISSLGFDWAIEYIPERAFFEVYPHASIIELFGLKERFPYKVSKKNVYWPRDSVEERNRKIIINLNTLRENIGKIIDLKDVIPPLEEDKKYSMVFLKGYEDVLDALVCAVTAYYYLEGKCRPFGDKQGVAWAPKVK